MPQRNAAPAKPRPRPKKPGQPSQPPARTAQPPPDPSTSSSSASAYPHLASHPSSSSILHLIRHALSPSLDSPDFLPTVQRIKGQLYDRRWLEVFNPPPGAEGERVLQTYAGRWVPGRVLCFRQMWAGAEVGELIEEQMGLLARTKGKGRAVGPDEDEDKEGKESSCDAGEEGEPLRIVSIGGGAGSEYLAIAALIQSSINHHLPSSPLPPDRTPTLAPPTPRVPPFSFHAIDIGSWSPVLRSFESSLSSLWSMNPWLSLSFCQTNILNPDSSPSGSSPPTRTSDTLDLSGVSGAFGPPAQIYTLLFTLSELLAQSRAQTIRLFASLTAHAPPGALLVIADAASDISDLSLGGAGRAWPGYMIADELLVGRRGDGGWTKLSGEDSRWFRLEEGVGADWPVRIENTRYWLRVYRRRQREGDEH